MPHATWPSYPSRQEVDSWSDRLARQVDQEDFEAFILKEAVFGLAAAPRHFRPQYIEFRRAGRRFYGIWQRAQHDQAGPLLVHLPGYGAEMSVHPELTAQGFHVLHVNPLGYNTPSGFDESLREEGKGWPVLPETILSHGQGGYVDWLGDALCAVGWARRRDCVCSDRLGFFGTSQGGGAALLLGSILTSDCKAICADLPFLTGFKVALEDLEDPGVYGMVYEPLMGQAGPDRDACRKAAGFIDTLSHAHRLNMPVLLTAGGLDKACPPATIQALFDSLSGTRSITHLSRQGHASTVEFLALSQAWMTLHV